MENACVISDFRVIFDNELQIYQLICSKVNKAYGMIEVDE